MTLAGDTSHPPSDKKNRQYVKWRRIFILGLVYASVAAAPAWVFGLNNVALLFPSAGIAFGALLIFGVRLWPGIVLGCLLEGLFSALLTHTWLWISWLTLLINMTASIFSPVFGCWLLKRWVNMRQILRGSRRSLFFVCLVTPIAYALGAALLFFMHWTSALFDAQESLRVLFMWWVGDTLGVLTLTPILLVIFSHKNRHTWWKRIRIILLIVALLALYFTLFANTLDGEEQAKTAAFMHDSHIASTLIQKRLRLQEEKQVAVGQLLRFAPDLSEKDWKEIMSAWGAQNPGSAGFGHAVFVEHHDRAAFEEKMRHRGFPAFQIRALDRDGHILPAKNASDYLVYMHIDPPDRDYIGMSAYNGSEQDVWLDSALFGKPMLATNGSLPWIPADPERKLVVSFQPIAGKDKELSGIIVAGIFMDELVKATVEPEYLATMSLCLTARSPEGTLERLYGEAGCETPAWETQKKNLPIYRATLDFGGQQWEMRALPVAFLQTPYFYQARHYAQSGDWNSYLLACLLIMILMLFFMSHATRIQSREMASLDNVRLLRRARRTLQQQERLTQFSQEMTQSGCWEQSIMGFCGSDNLCRMFGIAPGNLADWRQLLTAMHPDERGRFTDAVLYLEKHNEHMMFEVRLKGANGADGPETNIRLYLNSQTKEGEGRFIQGVAQDVTQELRQEQKIQFLSYHDPITQLGNVLYWDKHASQAVTFATKNNRTVLAIFEIALENMDKLVSAFGISVNRRIRSEVADRIRKITQEGDIVAWHGRGFSCCAPNLKSASEAARLANDLLESIKASPLMIDEREIMLSISIGIALFPEDGRTLDTLQRNAITALSSVRNSNQGYFQFFEPGMNRHLLEQLLLESALRMAIPRNELVLYYQPQIHLGNGKVQSCEALVRWQHPENGLILPGQFILMAEETGLILPLGQWVFTEACRQQVRWKEYEITIAVNISGEQFRRDGFVEDITRILKETEADPKHIELEITESALMNLNDTLLERIYTLKSMGFALSLDDFGTGYSSLSYLKRLPIDCLKLDQSFVMDLPYDADSCSIASAALLMAKELGMSVVAEGVENQAQMTFLQQHQCDILQGYYFSKPLPAPNFELWLQAFESHPTGLAEDNFFDRSVPTKGSN